MQVVAQRQVSNLVLCAASGLVVLNVPRCDAVCRSLSKERLQTGKADRQSSRRLGMLPVLTFRPPEKHACCLIEQLYRQLQGVLPAFQHRLACCGFDNLRHIQLAEVSCSRRNFFSAPKGTSCRDTIFSVDSLARSPHGWERIRASSPTRSDRVGLSGSVGSLISLPSRCCPRQPARAGGCYLMQN